MATASWRRISEGDPNRAVLAVDFDSTARPEAEYRDLAGLLEPSREIWQVTQPESSETSLLPAAEYVRWWQELPDGVRVDTVTGFCVGAVFAPALADAVAERQGVRPALLLVDPEPMDRLSLHRDVGKVVGSMTTLSEEERAGYLDEVLAACEAPGAEFPAVAGQVVTIYETAVGVVFDRLGLDEEAGEDLRGLFRSYVSYLAAARSLEPEPGWAPATALTSARPGPGAAHCRTELAFPVDNAGMLKDRDVAAAVDRFLRERAA